MMKLKLFFFMSILSLRANKSIDIVNKKSDLCNQILSLLNNWMIGSELIYLISLKKSEFC